MSKVRQQPVVDRPATVGVSQGVFGAGMVIALFLGFLLGYLYRGDQASTQTKGPRVHTSEPPAKVTDPTLEGRLLQATRTTPNEKQAWVLLANFYYDEGRYKEAIPAYRQALALDPGDVNARTDMGTALWYLGNPQEAVQEFEASLKRNPAHAQTLHNLGVVRHEGLKDPAGAVAAWRRLLASNPNYPDAAKIREQIAKAEQEIPR